MRWERSQFIESNSGRLWALSRSVRCLGAEGRVGVSGDVTDGRGGLIAWWTRYCVLVVEGRSRLAIADEHLNEIRDNPEKRSYTGSINMVIALTRPTTRQFLLLARRRLSLVSL